jgi:serine protease Do
MLTRLVLTALLFWAVAGSAAAHDRYTAVVETVAKAGPAVVNIRTEKIVQRRTSPGFGFGNSFFEEFFSQFGPSRSYRTQALGSGVVIDSKGYLVTNAHVVEKASKIFVAFADQGREMEASLVGIDPATDLAVVQVKPDKKLPSLAFADHDDLLLGETVIAIGNPLGLENSVTTGVVSAPRRKLADGEGGAGLFIQTDALINPGNSGGPLLDINGQLIGINTAIARQAQGIGFAIPVRVVRRVVDDLIRYGRVRPVYTGIMAGEISRAMVDTRGAGGVLVTEVEQSSPAAEANIQSADVILEVDGVPVDSAAEYLALLRTFPPGRKVGLVLLRGVEELQVTVRLASLPDGYLGDYLERIFGLVLGEDPQGVLVKRVIADSPAARIELRSGDRIVEVEGVRIDNLKALLARVEASLGRVPLQFAVFRGNRGYLVELP